MKYPIGIQDFKSIVDGGFVYVDKTALLHKMVTEGKIYFLSRPRRFGKSLLVSTLKYYFGGERELFRGLAIEDLEQEWEQYPVFHIDFNSSELSRRVGTRYRPNWMSGYHRGMGEAVWTDEVTIVSTSTMASALSDLLAHVHEGDGQAVCGAY